jgi:hypothetical protein
VNTSGNKLGIIVSVAAAIVAMLMLPLLMAKFGTLLPGDGEPGEPTQRLTSRWPLWLGLLIGLCVLISVGGFLLRHQNIPAPVLRVIITLLASAFVFVLFRLLQPLLNNLKKLVDE